MSKASTTGNVQVVCRVRPFNSKEIQMGTKTGLDFGSNGMNLKLKTQNEAQSTGSHDFVFDRVFDMDSNQKEVYDMAAKPIIDSVLEGFNGTIFAYGQTSSGKTHTMQGPDIEDIEMQGVIPRMVRTVFNRIESASENIEFTVKVSMVEIYMEKIKDLINPSKDNLKIHEEKGKGVYMADIEERYIAEEGEVYDLMKLGNSNRSISATLMNAESSRSHSIFILTVTQNNTLDLSCKTGQLYLVDLAGSEKISKTGAAGQTLEEAKMINKSLTTLGKVITALTDKKINHIPYRESKLTRILSESLGGNSKTCLIITCSPHPFNDQETLSTLRFGTRARSIKNNAKVNREYTIPELKKLLEKAEKEVELSKLQVKALEKIVADLGGQVPLHGDLAKMAEEEKRKQEEALEKAEQEAMRLAEEQEAAEAQSESNSYFSLLDDEEMKESPQKLAFDITSEEIQAKTDEIEILTEQLEKERNKLHDSQKLVADLKEELSIQQSRLTQVQSERDQLQAKSKEFIYKIQQLQESGQDKDDKIEQLQTSLDIMTNDKKFLKKSYESLMNKFKKIQEEHIMIPKKGGQAEEAKTAASDNSSEESTVSSDDVTVHLQEELRKLHFQLQHKNQIIKEIKKESEDHTDKNDGQVSARATRLQVLLQKEQESQESTQKDAEEYIKNLVNRETAISQDVIAMVKQSLLLSSLDLKSIMEDKNAQLAKFDELKEAKAKIESERDDYKNELQVQLEKGQPNVKEITDRMVKDALSAQAAKFDAERLQMTNFLQAKIEKNLQLEMQLDEIKDAYRGLEQSLTADDRVFKQKVQMLEQSHETMAVRYQSLVSERSKLKVDLQVAERKLLKKQQRLTQFEKSLQSAKSKNEQMESILKELRAEFVKMQSKENADRDAGVIRNQPAGSRVAIKGGGGKRMTTTQRMSQHVTFQVEAKPVIKKLQGGSGSSGRAHQGE